MKSLQMSLNPLITAHSLHLIYHRSGIIRTFARNRFKAKMRMMISLSFNFFFSSGTLGRHEVFPKMGGRQLFGNIKNKAKPLLVLRVILWIEVMTSQYLDLL
jgi:hypothetical protein